MARRWPGGRAAAGSPPGPSSRPASHAAAHQQCVGGRRHLLPADPQDGSPLRHLARFFARTTGPAYDDMSRLWLNARHLSRYRPVLRDRVLEQEKGWRGRLSGVIASGVEQGEFRTDEPVLTAVRILVVIDDLAGHANTGLRNHPSSVTRFAAATAERELGLADGTLSPAENPDTAPAPAPAPEQS
ncbi:TetR family transcriptional regulator C-terminal domain-containing protein [Streptomyces pyridomyceticus]|nr:TetR family transcriptional regulator C-terminal domain-containing protein [Streptomyces pyridomyceticus]